jgi:hypothetical protein
MRFFKGVKNELHVLEDDKLGVTLLPPGLVEINESDFNLILSVVPQLSEDEIKLKKLLALNSATVTVDGLIFDANPTSQERMLAAITAAVTLGLTESRWKLADNSIVTVTLAQLRQAQAQAQAILLVAEAVLGE